jgi:hypothetical protein
MAVHQTHKKHVLPMLVSPGTNVRFNDSRRTNTHVPVTPAPKLNSLTFFRSSSLLTIGLASCFFCGCESRERIRSAQAHRGFTRRRGRSGGRRCTCGCICWSTWQCRLAVRRKCEAQSPMSLADATVRLPARPLLLLQYSPNHDSNLVASFRQTSHSNIYIHRARTLKLTLTATDCLGDTRTLNATVHSNENAPMDRRSPLELTTCLCHGQRTISRRYGDGVNTRTHARTSLTSFQSSGTPSPSAPWRLLRAQAHEISLLHRLMRISAHAM